MNKQFDRQLFDQNDSLVRKKVKELLPWMNIQDNPDRYGVDLLVHEGDTVIAGIECERKRVWQNKTFPYDSVQFPARKNKYALLNFPVLFFMFNLKMDACLYVTGEDLKSSPLKEVSNVYLRTGEFFYQVPLSKANILTKE
jgi:hypothetical protein